MKRRYSARFKTMGVIGFVIIMISIINLPAKAYSNVYASAVLALTDSSVESDWEVCALATDLYANNSSVSNKNVRFWAYRKNTSHGTEYINAGVQLMPGRSSTLPLSTLGNTYGQVVIKGGSSGSGSSGCYGIGKIVD